MAEMPPDTNRRGPFHEAEWDLRVRLLHDVLIWTGGLVTQADTLLGIHPNTRARLIDAGELNPVDLGRYRREADAAEVLGIEVPQTPPPWRTAADEAPMAPWYGQGDAVAFSDLQAKVVTLFRERAVRDALAWTRGRQVKAAEALGVSFKTLKRQWEELGIDPDSYLETAGPLQHTFSNVVSRVPWNPRPADRLRYYSAG